MSGLTAWVLTGKSSAVDWLQCMEMGEVVYRESSTSALKESQVTEENSSSTGVWEHLQPSPPWNLAHTTTNHIFIYRGFYSNGSTMRLVHLMLKKRKIYKCKGTCWWCWSISVGNQGLRDSYRAPAEYVDNSAHNSHTSPPWSQIHPAHTAGRKHKQTHHHLTGYFRAILLKALLPQTASSLHRKRRKSHLMSRIWDDVKNDDVKPTDF